jgi:hypothetical protein
MIFVPSSSGRAMKDEHTCSTPSPFQAIAGDTFAEKFAAIGLLPGEKKDIRELKNLQERYVFDVYLYFDEALVRRSSLPSDLEDFAIVPPAARPFMQLHRFFVIIEQNDPDFLSRLDKDPVFAEIIDSGRIDEFYGCVLSPKPYLRALLL